MKRKRFAEEQIIGILKESDAGAKNQELCRKHGISEETFYRWRSKWAVGEFMGVRNDGTDPAAFYRLIQSRSASSIRVCQPGPPARKWWITSCDDRIAFSRRRPTDRAVSLSTWPWLVAKPRPGLSARR